MTVEVDHDGNGKLTLQISVWLKIMVSVLAACMAVGGGAIGHIVPVAHHDQQVDDEIRRLDEAVTAIRVEQIVNSEARIRSVEQMIQVKDQVSDIHEIILENRVLLKKHEKQKTATSF